MDEEKDTLYWDVDRLYAEILTEMKKSAKEAGKIPESAVLIPGG